ncbi:MAG: hypothetical protein ACXAC5_04420 [Promethearchaeota archaeon]
MDLIKNSTTIIILIYSAITIGLMIAAFTAGKDIGYTNGVVAGTNGEYINGVNDGVRSCLEGIFDRINMNRYSLPPQVEKNDKDETL